MKNLTLLLLLVAFSGAALAQTPPSNVNVVIESAAVTGVPEENLSDALRGSIHGLAGQSFSTVILDPIANRIQMELTDTLAGYRTQPGSAPNRIRVIFVVAHSSPSAAAAESNVNSQYTVESVDVRGIDRSRYSNTLNDDMQKMVGNRVDDKLIEELRRRFSEEVQNQYNVSQKIERGSQAQHVKVVFQAERTNWLFRATVGRFIKAGGNGWNVNIGSGSDTNVPNEQKTVRGVDLNGVPRTAISSGLNDELQAMVGKRYDNLEVNHLLEKLKTELKRDYSVRMNIAPGDTPQDARIVYSVKKTPLLPRRHPEGGLAYHSKQGFSLLCCDTLGPFASLNVGWDGDSLTERYQTFGFGIETTSLGTRRVGARLAFDTFGVQWKQQQRAAAVGASRDGGLELYRSRLSIAPSMAFAITRNVYATAGGNFNQVRIEGPVERWQAVHEGVASLRFDTKEIKHGKTTYEAKGGYEIRAGARSIGTDLVFTRHSMDFNFKAGQGDHHLELSGSGGKITGSAPMFERFTLGNTTTLRGWNKYDIAPLGGSRMWHSTIAYRYEDFGVFLDQGSIWDIGGGHPIRRSVGVTLWHTLGLGFPLQCERQCGPMFFVNFK